MGRPHLGVVLLVAMLTSGCVALAPTPSASLQNEPSPTPAAVASLPPSAHASEGPYGSPVAPTVPCRSDDPTAIPTIELVTPDGTAHLGQPYASTWYGKPVGPAGSSGPSSAFAVPSGAAFQVKIGGDVCAMDWEILYGAPPPAGPAPWKFSPEGELVPTVANNLDPAYASQNRFTLAGLPTGEWLLAVQLTFGHGLELVLWRVRAE